MLRKVIASVLLLLSALPFTAPFATVDMPTLLGEPAANQHETSLAPTVEDGSHALFAARAGTRIRVVSQPETDVTTHHIATPALYTARPGPAAPRLPDRTSLTALRI